MQSYFRFEAVTTVNMEMAVLLACDVVLSDRYLPTFRWKVQHPYSRQKSLFDWWLSLQPPAHAGFSLEDFSTLKMERIRSSETSVHTRSTWCYIPEDGILHSHGHENLKNYRLLTLSKNYFY
jgi:hypothetical protein